VKFRNTSLIVRSSAVVIALISVAPATGITLGQVDDFEDGTTMHWRGNDNTSNVPNAGPLGVGDNALRVAGTNRLVTVNDAFLGPPPDFLRIPSQWTGDYAAAGVTEISLDVRNPNEFDIMLVLGLANDTLSTNAEGGTYVTDHFFTIPPDDLWYNVTFSVAADDVMPSITNSEFPPVGAAALLEDVYQFRILHSSIPGEFRGDGELPIGNHIFLDNITAGPTVAEDADFDGDNDVDGHDFLIWQRGLGNGTTQSQGDADFNNVVNALDLAIWKQQFGLASALPAAVGIPEPGTASLALLAGAILLTPFCRRR
jgi:hypothetical protein